MKNTLEFLKIKKRLTAQNLKQPRSQTSIWLNQPRDRGKCPGKNLYANTKSRVKGNTHQKT